MYTMKVIAYNKVKTMYKACKRSCGILKQLIVLVKNKNPRKSKNR